MAWYDSLINGANTLGNIYNAAKPLINTGAAIYDRNQTRGAISDAFEQYKGYADKSLGALGQVYEEGRQATAPYRTAGQLGLGGYMNLLNDPSQIRNDPGYQWRTNQGAEAVTRKAASNRLLGSGNFATALQDYGQNQATAELDSALNRQVPLMQAGQTATGQLMDAGRNYSYGVGQINRGLGEAAGNTRLGQAGATSGMLEDIFGQNSQGGTLSNLGSNLNTANSLNTLYGQLSNAGNGSALAGAQETLSQTGQGTWGDLTTGPRTAAQMPAVGLAANAAPLAAAGLGGAGLAGFGTTAGTAGALGAGGFGAGLGAGTATALPGMGGTAAAFNSATAGIGAGVGSGGAAAAGGGGSATGAAAGAGWLAAPAVMVAGLKWLDSINWGKGGASESAKLPKMQKELTRRMQSDPSGQSALQFVDSIVNNQQWPNEGNADELSTLFQSGFVSVDTLPSLHGSQSRYDVWQTNPDSSFQNDRNYVGPVAVAQAYGLSKPQQDQYLAALKGINEANNRVQKGQDPNASSRYVNPQKIMAIKEDSRGNVSMQYFDSLADVPQGWSVGMEGRGDNISWVSPTQVPGYSQAKAQYDQVRSLMTEDRKRMYASALYDNYRSTGYQGDLSKLQRYLGV